MGVGLVWSGIRVFDVGRSHVYPLNNNIDRHVHGDGGEELHGGDEVGDGVVPQGKGQVGEAQALVEPEDEAEL